MSSRPRFARYPPARTLRTCTRLQEHAGARAAAAARATRARRRGAERGAVSRLDPQAERHGPDAPIERRAAGSAHRGERARDRRGRPARAQLAAGGVAVQCGGPLLPFQGSARRAARSALPWLRQDVQRRSGQLPVRHASSRAPTLGEPYQRLAPAHIHFSLFGNAYAQRLVTQMYFPDDPLFPYDPIYNSVPAQARAAWCRSSIWVSPSRASRWGSGSISFCAGAVLRPSGSRAYPAEP